MMTLRCDTMKYYSSSAVPVLCLLSLIISGAAIGSEKSSCKLQAVDLRCEYRVDPLGIDTPDPRLSWRLESERRGEGQQAYQILVASSEAELERGNGDVWDTGRVESHETIHIEYAGKPLKSGRRYYWKVRAWSNKIDAPSDWSESAWWEMALLEPHQWVSHWINDGRENPQGDDSFKIDPAPLFRKEFSLTKPVRRARLYITGLGYYDAQLNGKPVGDALLDPGWTDYAKRVYYSTFDVTDLLSDSPRQCLAVSVGNGWYNPLPLRMWGRRVIGRTLPTGRPRLIAQLEIEYTDGSTETIGTDPTWKVAPGPMLRNSIYLGEVYDARREIEGWNRVGFDDSEWAHAALSNEPVGPLQAQPLEPIRKTATLEPIRVTEPKPGIFIYDMGQNFAGRVRLKLDVPAGTKIDLRYGELLNEDGTLNPRTSACGQIKGKPKFDETGRELGVWDPVYPASAWQGDRYIAKGVPGETYENRFTFHAFRYIEVAGYPGKPPVDMIECDVLQSDLEPVGEFECSNELLNRIQKMCRWTFRSNVFAVQSDCPHRERFGYGGDLVTTCDALMLNYNMANFYEKTVRDWHDAAREDGMLTDTAPFVGIQYCGVGWAMIHPLLQQKLYRYYGDLRLIEEQYLTSKRWFDCVASKNPDHIITNGLSDHEGLEPRPAPPMVTPLYCESARILAELAAILNKKQESKHYADLSESIRQKWFEQFVDAETGVVSPDTQASHAFALYLDMLPQEMRSAALKHLVDAIVIENKGHLVTGIFGTKYALEVLSRNGRTPLVYGIVTNRDFPGWGYMLDHGATTLWEHWAFSDNTYSHNHPMFGSVSQWFFNWLGGIQPDPESIAFDRFSLRPRFVEGLDWVHCRYKSIRGPIVCDWKRSGKNIHLTIEIPSNASATLHIPSEKDHPVYEKNLPIVRVDGVRPLPTDGATARYQLESGKYRFRIPNHRIHVFDWNPRSLGSIRFANR